MTEGTTAAEPSSPAPLAGSSYRDATKLTQGLKILLLLSLLLDFVATVSGVVEFALLRSFQNGTAEGDINALATANDTRQQAIGIGQLALYVITGITFLIWIARANRNARALGAQGMRFTPGWSVGWFFVPIASLWKPFQVMREIWQTSAEPGNWQAVQTPPLLGWWWASYLLNQILVQVAYRMSEGITGIDSALTASSITTASNISGMAADVLAYLLVVKIAANQVWQAKTVEVF